MGKKAIVIGSGVGGLATAVRLLSKGFEVSVYEKEKTIGGRVNSLETKDFKFDLTASILMMPETYKEIFKWANRDYKDYIEFIKLDPIYRVNYSDGSRYDFSSDLVKLTSLLESISIDDSQGYLKFLVHVYEKYNLANKYFLQRCFEDFTDFFNPISMTEALKLKTLSTSYDFISKYIQNEKLRKFLAFQSLYVGISPYHGPNIYTLIPAISQIHGIFHIKGGMYSYIKALEKIIYELGGIIKTNVSAEEIIISDGKAVGIRTRNGIDKGDIIISNADFPYTMKNLIKEKEAKGKYTDEKLSDMKYSCSTFMIYLGLKKRYPHLLVHNMYLGDDFKENINGAFIGRLPDKPSLYIYCPSRIDETMAKDNKESLNITVRVPNLLFNNIKWDNSTILSLRNKVFNELRKIKGLEDIEENILYENYLTPEDLLVSYNSYGGTAFGLSPTLTQTNYFRPHFKLNNVDNLYFVGSSVHPGSGVSLVLLSSKHVSEEIIKNM